MPDTAWWLLAAAHSALWLTVTRRMAYDAPAEPTSNLPIAEMFKMGRRVFTNHPLRKEFTYVMRSVHNARQYQWVSDRSQLAPRDPPVTAPQRYAAVRHNVLQKDARRSSSRTSKGSTLRCFHVDDYISWIRQRVPVVFKHVSVRDIFQATIGCHVAAALDDDAEGLLPAAVASFCVLRLSGQYRGMHVHERQRRRRGSNDEPDGGNDEPDGGDDEPGGGGDDEPDGGDDKDELDAGDYELDGGGVAGAAGGQEEVVDAKADGGREADDAIVSRRPPSTRKRRRPENVYTNNASWELDEFFSRL